ncbi:MAG: hypothetical protein JWP25_5031 [Bradyrhizobium sp.]|nr:hypothetical protein [Bradyrhizobium sp.]
MGNGTRGRPRKDGERYPSGGLKPRPPAPMPSEISGALWQRMLADHSKVFSDTAFATELTRLGATGKLTPREVSTGLRIAGIYGRFEYYKGLSRSAASPHYIREFVAEGVAIDAAGFTADDAGEFGQSDAIDREQREQESLRAFKELQRVLPVPLRAAVEALCVENIHIGYQQLIAVREALGIVDDCLPDKTTGLSKKQKRAKRKRIRPELQAVSKAAPIKLNPLKTAFLKAQRKLSPHLDDAGLERAWDLLSALKSREDFRLERAR